MRYLWSATAGLSLLVSGAALAADVFSIDAQITEQESSGEGPDYAINFGSSNAEALFNSLDEASLRRLVIEQSDGQFNGDERISADIMFRGVPMNVTFNDFNGSALDFSIPAIDFTRQFDGGTREASIDQLVDYLKSNEDNTASRLSQELAKSSPNDPIAGNPASLQSQVAGADFRQSFTQKVSQVWGCGSSASAAQQVMLARAGFGCQAEVADLNFRLPAVEVAQLSGTASDAATMGLYDDYFSRIDRQRGENKLAIGLDYSQVSATPGGGSSINTSVLTLPLSYSFVFNGDPRKKVIVRMPISVTDSEGASGYQITFGVAYNHPMSNAWSLTPSVGYSAVGSEDLASAAALTSFSLGSSYSFEVGGWGFNIGNSIGSYSTSKLKLGDYESDPGISNTIFTNGLLVSGPSSLLASDLVVEYFINDTRYTGDDLFTDNAQEIGINFGKLNTVHEVVKSYIKGGISYTMASGDNDNKADVLRLSLLFKF